MFWISRIKDAPKRRSWEEGADNGDEDPDDELSESQKGEWTPQAAVPGPSSEIS